MNHLSALLCVFCIGASQAQTFTYTNMESGDNLVPLGYDVPLPVDSLTPVDGFRSYQSLNLRHSQLSAQAGFIHQIEVGQTLGGLPIYVYRLSDDDSVTTGGAQEGSALINGGIHAREWQSPEATTGYIEYLFDNQNDQHFAQYIIENLQLVVLPVLNIDGFLQTQRFATQVSNSEASPRDGRMRRKNMRDVDNLLATASDNLRGIDLNRNNAPYWATNNQRSSPDVNSIVHHGAGAGSEPETQALQQAAVVAGESRLRLYTDNHSFTQIYFAPRTGNQRRDDITNELATIMRAANDFKYRYGPSSAGSGIGSTDEYFANTYDIPSYTLEIEPRNSGADYGGFGPSHSGFILPNSEVSRMRAETTKATMAGLYAIADKPFLMGVEVWDEAMQDRILAFNWQNDGQDRVLTELQPGSLLPDVTYQLKLIFNKPMRWVEDNQATDFTTLSDATGIDLQWLGKVADQSIQSQIDTAEGEWLVESGYNKYKSDSFINPFSLSSDFVWQDLSLLTLEVNTEDMTGQALDANPGTPVDWQNGSWSDYEDSQGNGMTDEGGIDRAFRIIDDGSDLFAETPNPPNPPSPPSVPQPPDTDQASGGGGAMSIGFLLAVLVWCRWRK